MEPNTTGTAGGLSDTSSQLGGVKQELASDAKTLGAAARGKVEEQATAGKEQATQAARSTSSALNKAVDAMRDGNETPEWLTKGFERAAREIDKLAGSFEGKDMRAITGDVTDFARRSPVTFLGASAALGFVAARFLRAGSDYGAHQPSGQQTGSTGGTDFGAGSYASTQGLSGQDDFAPSYGEQPSFGGATSYDDDSSLGQGEAGDRSSFAFDADRPAQANPYQGGGQ